jgi:hypothetical protein
LTLQECKELAAGAALAAQLWLHRQELSGWIGKVLTTKSATAAT